MILYLKKIFRYSALIMDSSSSGPASCSAEMCALNQKNLIENLEKQSKKKIYKRIKKKIWDFQIENYQRVTFYFTVDDNSKTYAYKDYQFNGIHDIITDENYQKKIVKKFKNKNICVDIYPTYQSWEDTAGEMRYSGILLLFEWKKHRSLPPKM